MHIVSDLEVSSQDVMLDGEGCLAHIKTTIVEVGVQNVGELLHVFDGGGYTITVCLAESHVSLHTWPELGKVSLDVYLCNYKRDNSKKAEVIHEAICNYFNPTAIETVRLDR